MAGRILHRNPSYICKNCNKNLNIMNNNPYATKNLKSRPALIASGALLTLVLFLGFSALLKSYTSTVTVLVVTKSQSASLNQEKIVNNLAELPRTLNFYQRLLNDNPGFKQTKTTLSASEKKDFWNHMINVKRSPKNSSLLKISVTANNAKDAEKLSVASARTLFDISSSYYNIQTDLDLRLVDGPISQTSMSYWQLALLISITLGFLMAYLLQTLVKPLSENITAAAGALNVKMQQFGESLEAFKNSNIGKKEKIKDQRQQEKENTKEIIEPQAPVETSQKDQELERLNKIIQQDIYPNFPEMPISTTRKSSAPDNLPVGDDAFFMGQPQDKTISESEELESEQKVEEDLNREPTPEELKKRLNQLLKG